MIVKNLKLQFGDHIVQQNLNFRVNDNEIFVVMGESGCGKSTLLRHLIGLLQASEGEIIYDGQNLWEMNLEQHQQLLTHFGILYQSSALWSSLTLLENVSLPLQHHTDLSASVISDLALFKLSLVGLAGFEDYYPSEISGGMRKRAGLARAIALDPKYLFFDEPTSGLDPVSARHLDQLIVDIRNNLQATILIVTHDLDTIFGIADRALFLDKELKTSTALGPPKELLKNSKQAHVHQFLTGTIS